MKFVELSDSEREVMEVLWEKKEPMSFAELLSYFDTCTEKNWKKQTLNTFLFRMQQKGLLEVIQEGTYRHYVPSMTREEYRLEESKAFLDRNYEGSIIKMLTAFNGGEALEKDELHELQKLLGDWEKK